VIGLVLLAAVIAAGIYWGERWLPRETAATTAGPTADDRAADSQSSTAPLADAAVKGNAVTPAAGDRASIPSAQAAAPASVQATPPPAVTTSPAPASSQQHAAAKPAPSPAPSQDKAQAAADQAEAAAPSTIQFDKDTYVASEGDGMVKLTVKRTGSTKREAVFRWSLQPNSAEAGNDYAAIGPLTERIPAGSRTAVLTVPLVDDKVPERTEMFMVELNQEEGGPPLGALARAVVIIVDDD
jgi:hypothetical protein